MKKGVITPAETVTGGGRKKRSALSKLKKVPGAVRLAFGSGSFRKKKREDSLTTERLTDDTVDSPTTERATDTVSSPATTERMTDVVYSPTAATLSTEGESSPDMEISRYFIEVIFRSVKLGLSLSLVSQEEKLSFAITDVSDACDFAGGLRRGDELIAVNSRPVPLEKTSENFDKTIQSLGKERPLRLTFAIKSQYVGEILSIAAKRDLRRSQSFAHKAISFFHDLAPWYLSLAMAAANHASHEASTAIVHPACKEDHVAVAVASAAQAHDLCRHVSIYLAHSHRKAKALAALFQVVPICDQATPVAAHQGLGAYAKRLEALRVGATVFSEINPTTGLSHFKDLSSHDTSHNDAAGFRRVHWQDQDALISTVAAKNHDCTDSVSFHFDNNQKDDLDLDGLRVWQAPLPPPFKSSSDDEGKAPGFSFEAAVGPDSNSSAAVVAH